MILLTIVFYLCFDTAKFFPLDSCNDDLMKNIFYVYDCENEFGEQVNFTKQITKYFETHTKGSINGIEFSADNDSFSFLDGNLHLTPTTECSNQLDISEVMNHTETWHLLQSDLCGLDLSIIFIYNITDEEEHFINKTIESKLQQNIHSRTYFIIQSSDEKSPLDYVYYTKSFKDLNIDDIFPKICNLSHVGFYFTSMKYMSSIYYISNKLQARTSTSAECYCNMHGSNLLSLETYDEMIYFLEIIKNLYVNSSNQDVNIHLSIENVEFDNDTFRLQWDDQKPYTYFIPSTFEHWQKCFSITLSDLEDARSLAEAIYNDGKYLAKIDCETKIPNTLVVCEDNKASKAQIWSSNESHTSADDIWVVDSESFTRFMYAVVDSPNDINIESPHTYGNCYGRKHPYKNLLESYLCGKDLIKDAGKETNVDLKILISIPSKGIDHFYTIQTVDISECDNYTECQSNVTNETVDISICDNYNECSSNVTNKTEEISGCDKYNECQSKVVNETLNINSNTNVTIYCLDQREIHHVDGRCSAKVVNVNIDLEYSQCRTNEGQHFYQCIKDPKGQCTDNSNLLNCENFTCPEPLFKCTNSYCIFPFALIDITYDCALGEDESWEWEAIDENGKDYAIANISFVLRDLCMDSISFNSLYPIMNEGRFICKHACPKNYECVSSITNNVDGNITDSTMTVTYYTISMSLFKSSNAFSLIGDTKLKKKYPIITFVALYGGKCNIHDFDQGFQKWNFQELKILDLSNNFLSHSNTFKSIEKFSELKYLNLSYNENLIINYNFTFPKRLEIIDLSYTNISTLKPNAFYSLIHLRHLNLSYTLVSKFKNMGIPENFQLDTLYIQGFSTQYMEKDFFRGLLIKLELRASEFVMCCPLILNPKIDADKCFAPPDIISSCKHLVGDTFKKIIIWSVGIFTLLGNGSVFIYRIRWDREIFKQAYGLFISGLAVSDLIMGLYLIIVASVDAYFKDDYVLEDFHWRNGFVCPVLGIISTLSSEASSIFICLITLDRYLKITYPFGEHTFSKTTKLLSFILVWLVSFVLALIPVVVSDWEIYSSNGLCLALPFSSTQYKGWVFSFVVFVVLNFVLCLIIVYGQLMIFINLIKSNRSNAAVNQNRQRSSQERTVALKLAFVALTDFCCWFPVGILGILSVYGYIFNREVYAWIAVFVLPINSAINPIIYTLPALYSLCKAIYENLNTFISSIFF